MPNPHEQTFIAEPIADPVQPHAIEHAGDTIDPPGQELPDVGIAKQYKLAQSHLATFREAITANPTDHQIGFRTVRAAKSAFHGLKAAAAAEFGADNPSDTTFFLYAKTVGDYRELYEYVQQTYGESVPFDVRKELDVIPQTEIERHLYIKPSAINDESRQVLSGNLSLFSGQVNDELLARAYTGKITELASSDLIELFAVAGYSTTNIVEDIIADEVSRAEPEDRTQAYTKNMYLALRNYFGLGSTISRRFILASTDRFGLSGDTKKSPKIEYIRNAIRNIARLDSRFTPDTLTQLQEQAGLVNFDTYTVESLDLLKSFLDNDPETIRDLQKGDITVVIRPSYADHNGAFSKNGNLFKSRRTLFFEVSDPDDFSSIQTLLADRSIKPATVVITAHGDEKLGMEFAQEDGSKYEVGFPKANATGIDFKDISLFSWLAQNMQPPRGIDIAASSNPKILLASCSQDGVSNQEMVSRRRDRKNTSISVAEYLSSFVPGVYVSAAPYIVVPRRHKDDVIRFGVHTPETIRGEGSTPQSPEHSKATRYIYPVGKTSVYLNEIRPTGTIFSRRRPRHHQEHPALVFRNGR